MNFTMWSWGHYLFIVSPFILFFILNHFTKHKTLDQKLKIGVYFSVLAIIILILRNVEIWIRDDYKFSSELIPLQICHFANFVLLFAFLKNNQKLFALSFCLNLPAALMAIVFANSLSNYESILNFRAAAYILGHILIVSLTLWAVFAYLVHLNKKIVLKTLLLMFILYLGSLIVSNILLMFGYSSNYFYVMAPERGTPLETFYALGKTYQFLGFKVNPVYLLLTGVLGIGVVFIFYKLYEWIMFLIFEEKIEKSKQIAHAKE